MRAGQQKSAPPIPDRLPSSAQSQPPQDPHSAAQQTLARSFLMPSLQSSTGVGAVDGLALVTVKSVENCGRAGMSTKLFEDTQLLASLIRSCSVETLPDVAAL
eukprot:scaffold191_cov375-Pinguiococcus_pyrenoidosus.AAC.4